jgi:hypothetical protein
MQLVKGVENNRRGFRMIAKHLDASWVFIWSLWKYNLILVKRPHNTWNGKKVV